MKYIGAHLKKESGSLINTLKVLSKNGGNALQLFVSNPRSIQPPNVSKYEAISNEVRAYCKENDFKLVIHSPYTINLAKEPKIDKRAIELSDCYWTVLLINELLVSDLIGAIGVVVHVGKYTTGTKEDGLENMFNAMKYIVNEKKARKIKSRLILETPAGAGTELLNDINEFVSFYNRFTATEKKHLGICLDTAHIWSSGYDINKYYDIISNTNKDDIITIHYNNSQKELGSKVDKHETLFTGKIPISDMRLFIDNLKNYPIIILETPSDKLNKEIEWIRDI
jgi:deoxyribonuclease-4